MHQPGQQNLYLNSYDQLKNNKINLKLPYLQCYTKNFAKFGVQRHEFIGKIMYGIYRE